MFWYKNVGLSLEALKMLKADNVKFKFILAGDGDDRIAIEQYVKQLNLEENVTFAGPIYDRNKLRALYSIGDLFLFPSTYDTSGLVVKEAAACHCPSVVVSGSCAAEGVEDDFSGYLCEESATGVYDAIKRAISDTNKLKEVGDNANKHVYYSWEDSVRAARLRYDEVLFNHNKPKRKGWFKK